MIASVAFIGDAISSTGSGGVVAQETVGHKTRRASRKIYRNGKLVAVRTYSGGRWVTHRVGSRSTKVYRVVKKGTKRGYYRVKKIM